MHSSTTRLIATTIGAALVIGAVGLVWEGVRFGWTQQSAAHRLEGEVHQAFALRADRVQAVAERVSREVPLVADAVGSSERVAPLFARLMDLAPASDAETVSATVYVPAGPREYRVLAWSGGPAGELTTDRLAGPAALFVAQGPLGLRLVYVHPIESEGRRLGVAAAESLLSPSVRVGSANPKHVFATSFGPVALTQAYETIGAPRLPSTFLIGSNGGPSLEVEYSPDALVSERAATRRRTLALALVPLLLLVLLFTGRALDKRTGSRSSAAFLAWSAVAAAAVAVAMAGFVGLAGLVGAPPALVDALSGLAALGLVAIFLVSWWWRRPTRLLPAGVSARFVAEHTLGGGLLAVLLLGVAALLRARINADSLDQWQFPLFPLQRDGLLHLSGILLTQLALAWAAAMILASLAARWRLGARRLGMSLTACALWIAPTIVLVLAPHRWQPLPGAALVLGSAAAVTFALLATPVRRAYRRTTQAMRLIMVFAALLVPPLVLYPAAVFYAERTAHTLVETDYAPATTGNLQELRAELASATSEIDRMPAPQLLLFMTAGDAQGAVVPTQNAFSVWSRTSLSRTRVTSAVELYGASGALVSRFALNVPEYRTITQARTWTGSSCNWEIYGGVVRFGAEDRNMMHAERGVCGPDGRVLGAVVVRLVQDYEALPFISSGNPYYAILQSPDAAPAGSRLADLHLVVYGWSFHPIFTSSTVAWPLPTAIVDRLTESREPFWTTLEAGSRTYQVHVSSDRVGIYALGYPVPTPFEHLTRLAESATLSAVLFIVLLLGAAVYVPLARRQPAPLRTLFDEVRTSFYRKLFLFFVLAAVGPVLMLALAFGAYMAGKFRADVEGEAKSVVTVARRVLEELVALQQPPGQPQAALSDDVMVWIGRALDQDVNLFQGASLAATSQRDLFESGLLPLRTPAGPYRAIALDRLPTYVAEDRLGSFQYLVAAAPIPARGPGAILSVPLALRQREIEREIDELERGMLVGGVFVILFAAGLGASVARRVSDPVARLTRATRQIAAGKLDVRIVADTADELRRLVDDFNSMAATLSAQRLELARANQIKAWAEMARQVAHEIKNPLTPIQLAAEHLERVHQDQNRPLGPVFDQCVSTILKQVRLLRQIASEFSNFAGEPVVRLAAVPVPDVIDDVIRPYRAGLGGRIAIDVTVKPELPAVWIDRTLVARALTNVVENAVQAMPQAGTLRVTAGLADQGVAIEFADTGVGMDAEAIARAFEPYFSTKTAGSGLGLANAKRNVERCGGSMAIESTVGVGTTVTVRLPSAAGRGAARENG